MASEKDLELLDDYISNRLHGNEKISFEKRIEADGDLRSELKLQQSLIEGIKKARIAQLKTTLNNVTVPSLGVQTSVVAKLATSLVVAGVVGTGIYFYLNGEEKEKKAEQQIIQAENKSESKEPEPIREEVKSQPDASTIAANTDESSTVKKKEEIFHHQKNNKKIEPVTLPADEAKEPGEHKLDVFDPTEEGEGSHTTKESDVKASGTTAKNAAIAVEVDNANKKFNFHYQFKDEKLFLYGSFEKNLYEIMEFFSDDNKRTVFLFYKDNYYLLNEDNQKIKPLVPITDQALIKKLKESRG